MGETFGFVVQDDQGNLITGFGDSVNPITGQFTLNTENSEFMEMTEYVPVSDGTYVIGEVPPPAGWTLTEIDCGGAETLVDLVDLSVTVDVAPGQDVECTFLNQPAFLIVNKILINAFGVESQLQEWIMEVDGTGPDTQIFSLSDQAAVPQQEGGTGNKFILPITAQAGSTYEVGESLLPTSDASINDYRMTFSPDCTGTLNAGDIKICDVTNQAVRPPVVTDSALCIFDKDDDPTNGRQFRDIFTHSTTTMGAYRDTATNPGQTFFNIFYDGPAGNGEEFEIEVTLPYPYITKGGNPFHAVGGMTEFVNENGETCFIPEGEDIPLTIEDAETNGEIPSKDYSISLGTYPGQTPMISTTPGAGSTHTFIIRGLTPENNPMMAGEGMVYLRMHLDFGLKHTEPWNRGVDNTDPENPVVTDDAVSSTADTSHPGIEVTIWDNSAFQFSKDDQQVPPNSDTIFKFNDFKKIQGAVGLALNSFENPIQGATVEFYKDDEMVGSIETDENGYYYIDYKHKGKRTDFTIKLLEYGLEHTEEMKANKFILYIFNVP